MKLRRHLPAMSIAVGLTVGPALSGAWAQEQAQATDPERPFPAEQAQEERPGEALLLNGQLTQANEWVDKPILDEQGEQIGELRDLAIDVTNGRVAYALISLEQAEQVADRDLGDDLYAVPWEAFEPSIEHEGLTLRVDLQQFDPEHSFADDNRPDMTDEQWARQTHQQYGYQVYWQNGEPREQQPGMQEREQREQPMQPGVQQREQPEQIGEREDIEREAVEIGDQQRQQIEQALREAGADEQQAQQQAQQLAQRIEQEELDQRQIEQELRDALQQAGADEQQAQQQAQQLAGQLGVEREDPMVREEVAHRDQRPEHVESLDELIGRDVNDPQDESLAEVEDLVIDLREGRIPYAQLSYGGILGIGVDHVLVPWQALQFDAEQEVFVLDATEEQLDRFAFDPDDWPDMTDEQWASQIHTEFGQEPYWEVYGYAAPGEEEVDFDVEMEPGVQQLQQSLQQHMEQAGVDPQQAQQEAQRLAQQFQQERPDEQAITQQIQQTLEQAGVPEPQAQQTAQQAGPEVSQQLQQIHEEVEEPMAPDAFEPAEPEQPEERPEEVY